MVAAIATRAPVDDMYWEALDGDALIFRSRSILATKMLKEMMLEGADIMVILDDDVQFLPDDLEKIISQARELQEPVGGIYVTRSREPHIASMLWPNQPILFGPGQELVNVRYLATGFMAIPRKVLQAMLDHPGFQTVHGLEPLVYYEQGVGDTPLWDFFRPFGIREGDTLRAAGYENADERNHILSEDWAFCERARQCGFQIWADPTIILQHRAVVSVTVNDLGVKHGMLSTEGAPAQGRSVLALPGQGLGSHQESLVAKT